VFGFSEIAGLATTDPNHADKDPEEKYPGLMHQIAGIILPSERERGDVFSGRKTFIVF
jgi:hypothetical protein